MADTNNDFYLRRDRAGHLIQHTEIQGIIELVAGNVPGFGCINKFGSNPANAADTVEDVWDGGGTYSFPATALMTHLSQTADQLAMRGQTIEVQGLADGFVSTTQDVVLNGTLTTTPVALTTPLMRGFRMKVQADVVTTSPIRLHNTAETVDYAIIQTGLNQTLMSIYTVPANKTGYLISYYGDYVAIAAQIPTSVVYRLWAADRANSFEFQLKHKKGVSQGAAGFQHFFKPFLQFTEKTDIKVDALPDNKTAITHAGFDIVLVDS